MMARFGYYTYYTRKYEKGEIGLRRMDEVIVEEDPGIPFIFGNKKKPLSVFEIDHGNYLEAGNNIHLLVADLDNFICREIEFLSNLMSEILLCHYLVEKKVKLS